MVESETHANVHPCAFGDELEPALDLHQNELPFLIVCFLGGSLSFPLRQNCVFFVGS